MTEPTHAGRSDVLRLAVWAGLVAGLLEALLGIALQRSGWPIRVPVEILWIAPLVNLVLFLLAGIALTIASSVTLPSRFALAALLTMLAFGVMQVPDVMGPGATLILSLGIGVAASRPAHAFDFWSSLARRSLAALAATAVGCAIVGLAWPLWQEKQALGALVRPQPDAPNVLVITLDTLRADHVSAYGYARTTPNLDALARRGVLFEHAFANSSWTLPSHASLLTGRAPHEHRADWLHAMDGGIPTLAEALASRGYTTAAFAANASYVAPEWGLARGFSRFDVYGSSWADDVVRTAYGRRLALNLLPRVGFFDVPGRKRAARVNDEFSAWLDRTAGRPFFALLNYFDVHDPYVTFDPYYTRYSSHPAQGDNINFQFQPHAFRRKATLTADEIQSEIDAYDGCLAYLDAQLGALVLEMSKRGLDRNTLIVVTSDHGESFGNHDLFGHGNSLYLETLHVPLLMVWPDRVPSGMRVAQTVGLDRVPATIADLMSAGSGPAAFPGRSMAPLWTAGGAPAEPVLSEVTHIAGGPSGYPTSRGSLTSLVTQDWHLVTSTGGRPELYAWRRDPAERENLADSQEGRGVVAGLRQRMRQMGVAAIP